MILGFFPLPVQMHLNFLSSLIRKCFAVFTSTSSQMQREISYIFSLPQSSRFIAPLKCVFLKVKICLSERLSNQRLIHLLDVLHGDVVDVLEVDPVPVPLLHIQLTHCASHQVFSAPILRPGKKDIAEGENFPVWMPVKKLLHHLLCCVVLLHQVLPVVVPVLCQLPTHSTVHNLLEKKYNFKGWIVN